MKRNKLSRCITAIATTFVALGMTAGSVALADEIYTPDSLFEDIGASDRFDWQEYALIERRSDLNEIELPDAEPAFIAFAKDCADLDAIPLVELKNDKNRRVFVGINFDGVFGIHGQL